jgi:hypothetical protein
MPYGILRRACTKYPMVDQVRLQSKQAVGITSR